MSDLTGGRTTSPAGLLAAAGLDPARAASRMVDAGLWGDDGPTAAGERVIALASSGADPDQTLRVLCSLDRAALFELLEDDDWSHRVVAVAGSSRPLGELLARDGAALQALRAPTRVDPTTIAAEVAQALREVAEDQRPAVTARIRRRVTAAIAALDLTGQLSFEEVGRDLAALAEGVLAGTLDALVGSTGGARHSRVCVIGMGKLGGQELNYVSDVDVVFVHAPTDDDETAAREEAQRICAALLRILNATTATGRTYEVDVTLRPEGRDGPLSRTPASFVAYWQRWAEPWEFQALLKARPVAGDRALGDELLAAASEFVWPERLDAEAIVQVRQLKARVEAKDDVARAGDRQLKLGPGGLRDIEFAVQLLQLVHGRADRRLRQRSTLAALAALAAGGYVAAEDAATFAEAYRELRTVEHRLQLAEERRTHTIPDDLDRLEQLARSLGYRASAEQPARAPFVDRLRRVQREVRDVHAKLFYRPLLEVHAAVPATDAGLVGVGADEGPALDEAAAITRLELLGFRDARAVLRDVHALTSGVSRRAVTLRSVLPAMLHAFADTADPDGGVRALRTLVEAQEADPGLIGTLRDQPPAADLLARLLGTSELVGELLTAQPTGIEWLADPDERTTPRRRADLQRAALGVLGWQADLEGRQSALRRFKRRELARIVIRDLAGDAPVTVVGGELAGLGDACLEAGLAAVLESEQEPVARVAIIGLGKLGGAELHYPSDLDVVFVHEPVEGVDEARANGFAVGVAERVLRALSAVTAEGTAFEVDPELRPEGRSGPLSRSLSSCRTYYERWSEPWEHQALLRARHAAGDQEVGRAFVAMAAEYAYPAQVDRARLTALRRMKARVERERLPRRADPKRHLKLGPGGLTDVEWTVQLLQQQHGGRDARVRTTATMAAVDALEDAGVLDARDAQWLRDGYRLLALIRNRLYLLRARDVDTLPATDEGVERLARATGYRRGGRQAFEADYLRATRRVRTVMERRFYAT